MSLASYNHFVQHELPRTVNEMRPIVWSERNGTGASLSVTIQMHFASVQRPMVTEHQTQIMLPLQTQQLGRSYTSRLLVNVEIFAKEVVPDGGGPQTHHADIRDLCIGDIPVLVGSCLCHQPNSGHMSHFIVNGQNKVIVSQERLLNNHPLISACVLQNRHTQYTCDRVAASPARPAATRPARCARSPRATPTVFRLSLPCVSRWLPRRPCCPRSRC